MTATTAEGNAGPRRRRRRWLTVGVATIVLIVACHAPLLRGLAGLLIVDDPPPAGPAYVLVWSGDRQLDVAADLYRKGAVQSVLLVEEFPPRLVQEEIMPSREQIAQKALAERGLPQEAVTVVPGRARNDWQEARLLAQWQKTHPGMSVIVLCERFDSARQSRLLNAALGESGMQALRIRALPDRRFDESDWWKSREGLKWAFHCTVAAAYDAWCGEPTVAAQEWDADEYERQLKASLQHVASAHE